MYDDFGNAVSETSPERGTITRTFDAADNLASQTDARSITAAYEYDALNRLTAVRFPDPSENITYLYDVYPTAKGHLWQVQDATGTTTFLYDSMARVTQEIKSIGDVTYRTHFMYTAPIREWTMTPYPHHEGDPNVAFVMGRTFDAAGRISGFMANNQWIVRSVTYAPFGPPERVTFGNNAFTVSTGLDSRYLPTRIHAQGGPADLFDLVYPSRDGAGNVTQLTGIPAPLLVAGTETSTISPTSNRLTAISGPHRPLVPIRRGRQHPL